jgi:hypothetical protein
VGALSSITGFVFISAFMAASCLAKFGFTEQECTRHYGDAVYRESFKGDVMAVEFVHFVKDGIRVVAGLYAPAGGTPRVVMLRYLKENLDEPLTVPEVDQLMENSSRFSVSWSVDTKASDDSSAQFRTPDRKYFGWATAAEVQEESRGPLFKDLFVVERNFYERWAKDQSSKHKNEYNSAQKGLENF